MNNQEPAKPVSARAVVTVVLEVEVSDRWSTDTSAEQIFRQAKTSALDRLSKSLGCTTGITCKKMDVTTVLAEEKSR